VTLAIDGSSPAEVDATSGNATTASFTAPAGALLVALADVGSTGSDGDVGSSISDSGTLTWTLIGRQRGAGYDEAVAWWAVAPSATSRTVTVTATTNTVYKFLQVLAITGADTTTPIGDVDQGNVPSGTLSASVTSSAAGSMALAAYADWNAGAEPTAATGTTAISAWRQNSTGAALRRTALSTAATQTMTVATSAPTAKIAYVLFEVLAATGGGTSLQLLDTFTGSAGSLDTPGRTDIDWQELAGSLSVDGSGHATGDSAGSLDVARTVDALPTTGMRVEVDITDLPSGTARSVGAWVRMGVTGALEGYSAEVDRVSGVFTVIRWVAGSGDNINGGFGTLAVDPGSAFTLALSIGTDDYIRVYIDNQIIWEGTDPIGPSALAGNTHAGWSTYNSNGTVAVTEFRASNLGDSVATPAAIRLRIRMPTPAALVDLDQLGGLIARWLASDLALSDGAAVSTWTPSAGLEVAVDAVNAGSFRPTLDADGGPTGGKAVRFSRASFQSLHATPWSGIYDTPLTTIVVWRPASLDARAEILAGDGTPYVHLSHLPLTLTAGAGAPDELADPTVITTSWHATAAVFDGASSRIYHDSLTATASGTTSTTALNTQAGLDGLNIGTNTIQFAGFFEGLVAEVLVLNRAVGAAEMAGILGQLAQVYDLPWAPAPGEEGPPAPPPSGGGGTPAPTDGGPATYWNTDAPRPRIGLVLDAGPTSRLNLPIPIESGGDAGIAFTFEQGAIGISAYTPGANTALDVVTNPFMVLAGTQSMTMTRTGSTGTASWQVTANLDDLDMSSRTYLFWVPIRPADGAPTRTATLTVAWQTSAGGSLGTPDSHTQTEGDGYVSVQGYTWIGLLSTAPSTRPGRLVIQLSIAGVAVDEIHHVDGWYFRYYGIEIAGRLRDRPGETRGRSDDLQRFEAGGGSLQLRNDDGQLTSGGDGYDVGLRNQVTMLWEWGGHLYPHFVGYSGEWTGEPYLEGIGDVQVPLVDLFDVLSGKKIWPPYQSDILLDRPAGYLPLGEPQTSRVAGSIAGGGGSGVLRPASAGTGGSVFGAQSFEPVQISTHTGDGDLSCLNLNPSATGGTGDVLDVSSVPGALPDGSTPWVLTLRVQQATASGVQVIWRVIADYLGLLTAFQLDYDSSGRVRVIAWTGSTWDVVIQTTNAYDGSPWTLEVKYDPAGGGTYGTVRLRIGPESISHTLTADPWAPGVPVHAYLGGIYDPSTADLTNPWVGQVAHLALWNTDVSDFRLDLHQTVISVGFGELEKSRIEGILLFAGISQAYARIDAGLSPLLPAHRSGQTPVLTALQDAAAAAGGHLFMSADGRIMYHDRLHRGIPYPRFIFDGDDAPLVGSVSPRLSRARLANTITVSRTGGATYRITDPASIAKYDEVEAPAVELAVQSEAEVEAYGKAVIKARATPRTEIRTLEWAATGKPSLLGKLLRLEIGDFIQAGDLPADVVGTDFVTGFVEQIATSSDESLTDMRWRVSLSPASAQITYGEIPNTTPPPPPVTPPPDTPPGSGGGGGTAGFWPSGGSVDTNAESTSDEWGSWRGRTVDLCLCYNTRDAGWGSFMPNTGQPAAYHSSTHRLMIQTSPFPEGSGCTWDALISGAYDSQWEQWANYIETADAAAGRPATIVNVGWELNGSYFPWGYNSGHVEQYTNPSQYKAGFERISDILKANYSSIKVGWVMNLHQNPMDSSQIFPNPAKLDHIGVDYYDMYPPSPNHDTFLSLANEVNGGVLWYLSLARQYDKLLSVPEWGVVNEYPNGGGDSANYVNWMFDDVFANAHSTGHMGGETYFTYGPSDLRNGSNPNAAAQYVARYHT
jgi:hypothetical protein